MTDVLIRDVPEDVIAALDAHAARLGLSRSEYVRRRLAQDAATPGSPVSVEDLARFAGYSSALTISSHIFLASPNSIIVLSRKKSSFSTPA